MANKTHKKKYPVLDKNCKGCRHYNTLRWCDYGENEKHLRMKICPGGDKCTVKEIGKKTVRERDFTIFEGYDPGDYYYSTAKFY